MIFVFRICELLDYTVEDVHGLSIYDLVHAEDVYVIKRTHEDCKFLSFSIFLSDSESVSWRQLD